MKKFILLLLLLNLFGCSSSIQNKNYFQLISDFNQPINISEYPIKNVIFIDKIQVANYLNRKNIIYQVNDIQFVVANNNLWSDSLSMQLRQRIIQDFSVLYPNSLVTTDAEIVPDHIPKIKLQLFIDSFHGRYTGDALIKGHWLITDASNNQQIKTFDYQLQLPEDGYAVLVKTLSKGWQEEEIALIRLIK